MSRAQPGAAQPTELQTRPPEEPAAELLSEAPTELLEVFHEEQVSETGQMKIMTAVMEFFTGPLPHHRHFAAYEATTPGAGDRILRMAEKEQDARHNAMWRRDLKQIMGLTFGFITLLAIFAAGVFALDRGHVTVAVGLWVVDVILGCNKWIIELIHGRPKEADAPVSPQGKKKAAPRRRRGAQSTNKTAR